MNLLIITSNPERASFRQRIEVYLDFLKADGVNFDVELLPEGITARGKLFKKAVNYDGVLLHKKKLNVIDAIRLRKFSKKLIYNFDDAIMYSDKNPQRKSLTHHISFRRTVRVADFIITGSNYLAEHAKKYNPNVTILPIGLNTDDYKHDHVQKDGKLRLVWIGSKSTLIYLREIKPVIEDIGRRFDNVILRIIADDFFDMEHVKVEKRLWSKDTRGKELATSDIGLAPLPDDRFTRGKCSFKVLEYSASGLPVIASPIGTNEEYIRENITGFLVTDHQQWIDKITQLIENPQLRKKMGQEGRIFAGQSDINIIGKQFSELIINCLQNTSPAK